MSSFTPNIGLENPPYLGQVGTWGTTENTARSMIDQSLAGQATFTLTGPTFAINVTNGAPTTATCRVWIFSGTPSAPVTVTFGPNTAQNWVFVINNTAQPVTFAQGTGTTVTVIALGSNVVYFDGAGAAANVAEFPTVPTQPPGSVTSPSYSYVGFPDVGLYVPGPSALAIAANGATLASFKSSGAGPSGLNLLGATMGPYIGNAFANLDLFGGAWAGPPVPPGYSFLYLDEPSGQCYLKYLDSGNMTGGTPTQRLVLLGSYLPGNVAVYIGAPPQTIGNSSAYFLVNEAATTVSLFYKDSAGTLHGPFATQGYGSFLNQPIFVGAAPPATVMDQFSYFQINEARQELDWYYRDLAGTLHGPVPAFAWPSVSGDVGAGAIAEYVGGAPSTVNKKNQYFVVNETTGEMDWYYKDAAGTQHPPVPVATLPSVSGDVGAGALAQYVGAVPRTVNNKNQYFEVNEANGSLNWFYQDSGGTLRGPVVIASYGPVGLGGWVTSFVPAVGGATANNAQCVYLVVGKACTVQMLFQLTGTFSTGAVTVTLPVPTYTGNVGSGAMAQNLFVTNDNPGSITFYHVVAFASGVTVNYTAPGSFTGTINLQISGTYMTN